MNKWKPTAHMHYYYRESDGRVLGSAWHYASNSAIWIAKIFEDEFPFTNASEKFLGNFVDEQSAKIAVENYWFKQSNTLEYVSESSN
ncbi:MAG: hypothetical protein EB127_02455 [Alphaproteobacteria bacterium]|nr:hypothetical protein [Alphaproteobacteria bacterium]